MLRTTIMLPTALKQRAEARARQLHVSLGEFLRQAVERQLEREELAETGQDPLAGNAYIIHEPSPAQVSENIDRYLYGEGS